MKEPQDLVINNFGRGIADSPALGFANVTNVDIHTVPGMARAGLKTVSVISNPTITGLPLKIVKNPKSPAQLFAVTDGNQIIKSTDSGSTWSVLSNPNFSSRTINGLEIWKDWLIVTANEALYGYGPLSSSPAWANVSNAFTTILTTSPHPSIAGQDDILYFGDGRYVSSIQEASGKTFSPNDSTTYTTNIPALTLPIDYVVTCLAEYGKNLMVGAGKGITANSPYGVKVASVFPWDRTSTSFNLPLIFNEFAIQAMQTIGNMLYIIAGTEGVIYLYNGYSPQSVRRLATPLQNLLVTSSNAARIIDTYFNPNAIMNHKGRLFFANSYQSSNGVTYAVWSLDLNGILSIENLLSDDVASTNNNRQIGCLFSVSNDTYLVGWKDGTLSTSRIDIVSPSNFRHANGNFIETQLFRVGYPLSKRKFTQAIVELAEPLSSGQVVAVDYRTANKATYTNFITFDYTTFGAIQSQSFAVPFEGVENLQLRIDLRTSDTTSPLLNEIRLI